MVGGSGSLFGDRERKLERLCRIFEATEVCSADGCCRRPSTWEAKLTSLNHSFQLLVASAAFIVEESAEAIAMRQDLGIMSGMWTFWRRLNRDCSGSSGILPCFGGSGVSTGFNQVEQIDVFISFDCFLLILMQPRWKKLWQAEQERPYFRLLELEQFEQTLDDFSIV